MHDGSYDYFNAGEVASKAVEYMAEDEEVGNPNNRMTPEFVEALVADGLDLSKVPSAKDTRGDTIISVLDAHVGQMSLGFN